MGHQGPTVISPWLGDVQLVAAPRTVFTDPQLARLRVDGRALNVAVSIGPDLRQGVVAAKERVIARGCAVPLQPHHLPQVGAQILGLPPPRVPEPFPERHEQGAVPGEDQAGAKVQTARIPGQLAEDNRDPFKGGSVVREPRTGHCGGVGAVGSGFAVGQPEQAVAGKRRIRGHVQ